MDGIDVLANNVTVRNGTVSGFGSDASAVSLPGSVGKAEDLRLLGNLGANILLKSGNDKAVANCVIIEANEKPGSFGILVQSGSGDLVKGNQISECAGGIVSASDSGSGCAVIHNYIAKLIQRNRFERV